MSICRFCDTPLGPTLVDLGETPLANSYLPDTAEARDVERRFPLHARVCPSCWLVQLDFDASETDIFAEDYAYLSSFSNSWVAHAKYYADTMITRFELGSDSRVVEIASNDGYLLEHFVAQGVPVLGVEPAGYAASVARKKGVETRVAFFGAETADALKAEGYEADLMTANNVLAHVPDIRDFLSGFATLLKPTGVVTFEFPSLINLVRELQFDTIYHEHYSYLSLCAVERMLASVGLVVFDVEALPTHGGSLRVFAAPDAAGRSVLQAVHDTLAEERTYGLETLDAYVGYAERVAARCAGFRKFLDQAKSEGELVAAYGAAAKGNTFLNACAVTTKDIVAVGDRNDQKQGKLLPGTHIPVRSPDAILALEPDYIVILPWNLRAEIAESMDAIRMHGGRFVLPGASVDGSVEIF